MSEEVVTLPGQNVTLVGAFNPAIFHPEWMLANLPGLEPPIDILLPAPAGLPLLRAGDLYLVVSPDRLVLYGPLARAGRIAGLILQTLPHTPLRAAGINLQYKGHCDRSASGPWRLQSDSQRVRELLLGEPGGVTFSQVARRSDGVQVALKLSWPSADDEVLLDLNYHLDAPASREKRGDELVRHVERATAFEQDAQRIRQEILIG